MVGIFQLFGINFLFWTIVGFLRFAFETLQRQWKSSHTYSYVNLCIASAAGTVLVLGFLFLFFFNFSSQGSTALPFTGYVSAFGLWLFATAAGAYFAARMFVYDPYGVSFLVGLSSTAAGAALLFNVERAAIFIPETTFVWALWVASTIFIALAGGWLAREVNKVEDEDEGMRKKLAKEAKILPKDIAVVISAYNEELTISSTIDSLTQFADVKDIYIGSNGSTDNTPEVVRKTGAHLDEIPPPNLGKARALMHVLKENDLVNRYKAVFFVDADLQLDKDFYRYALPQFDDPQVVAVIGHAVSMWPKHYLPKWKLFFTAYRIRLWRVLQYCLRFGQTWKYMNVSPIVPGGGSIYRAEALRHINVYVPGLLIEDFNMTFNIHHQKLGKIAFDPKAFVIDQEPFSLHDYTRQIKRWYIGFFQTFKHHGLWPSWFCLSTTLFTLEMLLSSLLFLAVPFLALELLLSGRDATIFGMGAWQIEVTLLGVAAVLLLFDYIITIGVALIERKPLLLIYGVGFIFLRYVEAAIFLYAMIVGLFKPSESDGKWISPKRVAFSQN